MKYPNTNQFSKIFDPDSSLGCLSDLEVRVLRVEQVSNILLVNLQKRALDGEFCTIVHRGNMVEDMRASTRDDSLRLLVLQACAEHGEALTGSGLPIREDGSVISL